MPEKRGVGIELSAASVASVLTCLFGIVFGIHFSRFFDLLHMYSFSADYNITVDSYNRIIWWVGISQIVFYALYGVLASALMVRKKKFAIITLEIMCLVRCISLALLFVIGFYLVFQIGFSFLMEIVTFILIIHMNNTPQALINNPDRWKTIGTVGVLSECIPFVQYIQYVFDTNVSIVQSFTAVMVPIFVGVTIYALAFYFAYPYLPESIAPDDEETEN